MKECLTLGAFLNALKAINVGSVNTIFLDKWSLSFLNRHINECKQNRVWVNTIS